MDSYVTVILEGFNVLSKNDATKFKKKTWGKLYF